MRSWLKTQLIVGVATLVALELVLQLVCQFSHDMRRLLAPPWQAPVIADQRFRYRGNPLHRDADASGYRNPSRPAQADIVVLGDSQTYGPERRDDAWPSVLAKLKKASVYNMALHGYEPLQSYLQLDDALSLRPKLVVVAPYFGNDFYEAFLVEQRNPADFASWVSPELLSQAAHAEHTRSIKDEVGKVYRLGEERQLAEAAPAARRWLSENIRLYGFVRALRDRLEPTPATPLLSRNLEAAASALTPDMRRYASVLDGPEWRTILTAPYRNRVLDDSDPRIRAGFEAAREAIHKIVERCKSAGVDVLVVLIPTKELVFLPRIKNPSEHTQLVQLVANETRLRREWIDDLRAQGIRHIDTLAALSAAAEQPYPEDIDGHLNAVGHRIIAVEVQKSIADIAVGPVQ